jgi:hypothetical protein
VHIFCICCNSDWICQTLGTHSLSCGGDPHSWSLVAGATCTLRAFTISAPRRWIRLAFWPPISGGASIFHFPYSFALQALSLEPRQPLSPAVPAMLLKHCVTFPVPTKNLIRAGLVRDGTSSISPNSPDWEQTRSGIALNETNRASESQVPIENAPRLLPVHAATRS